MKHPARSDLCVSAASPRVIARGVHAARGVHLTLRTVREAAGATQDELARATGMDQADVSRLERRDDLGDCQVSTLRRYVEALGGSLQVVAVFGDKRITLVGTTATAQDAAQPIGVYPEAGMSGGSLRANAVLNEADSGQPRGGHSGNGTASANGENGVGGRVR